MITFHPYHGAKGGGGGGGGRQLKLLQPGDRGWG